ncbi:MAG: phosphatidylserine decarboxylase family protein, partial [Nitrospiraceae bacterium]
GLPFVVVTGGSALLASALGLGTLAVPLSALTLFTAWFFRNPKRLAPRSANVVVAPGDGRVIAIDEEYEPRFLKDRGIRISIFLNIFDVHVNRIPCSGTIEDVVYQPGTFFAANRSDAMLRNEQNALMISTAPGAKVLCIQVAGLLARRIVCWAMPGESVVCGERFGLIRFGSRMDLFLPLGTKMRAAVGDRVKGGETVLGELECAARS